MGTAATATAYTGTFHGTVDQVSPIRREVARHLGDCPVTDDAVLVASEFFFPRFRSVSPKFALMSRTKCLRQDGSQVTRPMLGLIAAHPYWRAAEADLRASAPLPHPPRRCLSRSPLIPGCLMRHTDRGEELAANAILHSRSRGQAFTIRVELHRHHVRVECHDSGGPWRSRRQDDRPHGLHIVEALTGPDS